MLALVFNRLSNVLASDSIVWRLHDLTQSACLASLAWWALSLVPYRNLKSKCIAAVITGMTSVDFVCSLLNASGYWYWVAAQIVFGVALACFYAVRPGPESPTTVANDGHVYCLRIKPDGIQDFLISLAGYFGAGGGYALYCNGDIYRYRHGIFVRQRVAKLPANRYYAERGGLITPSLIEQLDRLIGSRWTWRQNCLTVLRPIWGEHNGRSAQGD